eukprot:COSAG02_NODE_3697_length_6371_cov_40.094866_6_plen_59_part_00
MPSPLLDESGTWLTVSQKKVNACFHFGLHSACEISKQFHFFELSRRVESVGRGVEGRE